MRSFSNFSAVPDFSPRVVHSNQEGPHPDLDKVVRRHLSVPFRRPVAQHTLDAFSRAAHLVESRGTAVVLDSGCGTGESTLKLAERFPTCTVLGVDKSEVRLDRASQRLLPNNAFFVRADLQDFWPLVAHSGWEVRFHALFYPNPWPKSAHLMRRFHGHPVFPVLLGLAPELELRTNWEIYAQEFVRASEIVLNRSFPIHSLQPLQPMTAFERKYSGAGQALWQVRITPPVI